MLGGSGSPEAQKMTGRCGERLDRPVGRSVKRLGLLRVKLMDPTQIHNQAIGFGFGLGSGLGSPRRAGRNPHLRVKGLAPVRWAEMDRFEPAHDPFPPAALQRFESLLVQAAFECCKSFGCEWARWQRWFEICAVGLVDCESDEPLGFEVKKILRPVERQAG